MTEQEKTSAVVEETREAWTPRHNLSQQKKRVRTIPHCSQRGGYRYCSGGGRRFVWLGKQQAVNQTATSDALANQLTHCKKPRRAKKPSWKALLSNNCTT